jgi:hypothetical protein
MGMKVTKYAKAFKPGVLVGTFSILYDTEWGPRWEQDIKLFMKNGHRWCTFPSRSYKDESGLIQYFPMSGFQDRQDHTKWQKTCIDALDTFCANHGQANTVQLDSEIMKPVQYKDD